MEKPTPLVTTGELIPQGASWPPEKPLPGTSSVLSPMGQHVSKRQSGLLWLHLGATPPCRGTSSVQPKTGLPAWVPKIRVTALQEGGGKRKCVQLGVVVNHHQPDWKSRHHHLTRPSRCGCRRRSRPAGDKTEDEIDNVMEIPPTSTSPSSRLSV